MSNKTREIKVPILARVEGEGALQLKIRNQKIASLELKIYEPPRLFEKFLEGREPNEVIDSVARICGICPVAYQMSAVHAIEQIFAIDPGPWVRAMRRLFYCGEWLESHGIHIHILAAPDFLGYGSVIEMAKAKPEIVKRGMRLQLLGKQLLSLLGKRSVNPVGVCVGGFYFAPKIKEVEQVLQTFEENLELAAELLHWSCNLPLPDYPQQFTSVALQHANEYPMNEGRIVSDSGLDLDSSEFDNYFKEFQVPYSNALHCQLQGNNYLVGPLARVNLNFQQLPAVIRNFLTKTGISFPSNNMFHSIVARCIEVYYAMIEAIRIMKAYQLPEQSSMSFKAKSGVGYGCTEAPRGLLWHRYEINEDGLVKSARIVPPTSQNQGRIEADLRDTLTVYGLQHSDLELRLMSEKIIRNYDPCISCSTHFLQLNVIRQ